MTDIDFKQAVNSQAHTELSCEKILGSELDLAAMFSILTGAGRQLKVVHDYLIVANATKGKREEDGFVAYRAGVSDFLDFITLAAKEHADKSQKQKQGSDA